jgi:hypothetical protein
MTMEFGRFRDFAVPFRGLSTRHPSIHEIRATQLVDSSFRPAHLPDAAGTLLCFGRMILRSDAASSSVLPSESMADTQPRLQPALLILSAMISQYFMGRLAADEVWNKSITYMRHRDFSVRHFALSVLVVSGDFKFANGEPERHWNDNHKPSIPFSARLFGGLSIRFSTTEAKSGCHLVAGQFRFCRFPHGKPLENHFASA